MKSNTILLLRVTFFDESSNRYDTFDIKAHILKATPVDLIIGRDSIKSSIFFQKYLVNWELNSPLVSQVNRVSVGLGRVTVLRKFL